MSSFTTDTRKVINRVLEDTRYAYKLSCQWDHPNADYADYASSQALPDFRTALSDQTLTYEKLAQILRKASEKERRRQCKTPWAMFMTNYIERNTGATGKNP